MNIIVTASELGGMILGGLFALIYAIIGIKTWYVQSRCKHDGGVNETRACDAICRKCLKNLGFIGTWRDKQQKKTTS